MPDKLPSPKEAFVGFFDELGRQLTKKTDLNSMRKLTAKEAITLLGNNEFLMNSLFASMGILKKSEDTLGFLVRQLGKYDDTMSAKVLRDLDKTLAPSLRKYATSMGNIWGLNNISNMELIAKNVAPKSSQMYRPALRLSNKEVLWHPKARIHSDTILLNLKGKRSFDYSSIMEHGGIGPDGHFYAMKYDSDALYDIFDKGIKDTSGTFKP